MSTIKSNDWIVANINNPDFNNVNFADAGLNKQNTQLLDLDSYLNSSFIQNNPNFKDKSGKFDKDKFTQFYKQKASSFNDFITSEAPNFQYDLFDATRTAKDPIKNPHFQLIPVSNPAHYTIGVTGINDVGESPFSTSELAQQQHIKDANGKDLGYSPNDATLFNNPLKWVESLFSDPIALATWDSNGTDIDPITGLKQNHKKGDPKLNENGEYYYEKLGGRSPIGKQVLSSFDTITVDGSPINNFDPLDSDGKDKSVGGILMKNALAVAPLFMGNKVSAIYSGALIARELGKSLNMLYNMVGSWVDAPDSPLLNGIEAKMNQLTTSSSEYAQAHPFSFENITGLMSDVATQWGQQKLIANSLNGFRDAKTAIKAKSLQKAETAYNVERENTVREIAEKTLKDDALKVFDDAPKWSESTFGKQAIARYSNEAVNDIAKNQKIGQDISLAYMAIISNSDVYNDLVDRGLTKKQASLISLGAAAGMFGVDKYAHLGELFFNDIKGEQKRLLTGYLKGEYDNYNRMLKDTGKSLPKDDKGLMSVGLNIGKNGTNKYISKITSILKSPFDLAKNYANDLRYHTTSAIGKAIGEGIEETAEEFVTDLSKQIGAFAGLNTGAWENAASRYGMSFLGGTAGGGLFYGVDRFQNGGFKLTPPDQSQFLNIIANGGAQEALNTINRLEKNGIGDEDLSYRSTTNSNGERTYLTSEGNDDTQNHWIAQRLRENVNQLNAILTDSNSKLSDEGLYKQMIGNNIRLASLQEQLGGSQFADMYRSQYRDIIKNLAQAKKNLQIASSTRDGSLEVGTINKETNIGDNIASDEYLRGLSDAERQKRQQNIQKYSDLVDTYQKQLDNFNNGEYSLDYTRKMLFSLSPVSKIFVSATFPIWLQNNKNKNIEDLTPAEEATFKEEYKKYQDGDQKVNLQQKFELYKAVEDKVLPVLQELSDNQDKIRKNAESYQELLDPEFWKELQTLNWDSKLDTETEEEYNNRNQAEGESDKDYYTRRDQRLQQIRQKNEEISNEFLEKLNAKLETLDSIDPITARSLKSNLTISQNQNVKDIIANTLNKAGLSTSALTSLYDQLNSLTSEQIAQLDPKQVALNLAKDIYNNEVLKPNLQKYDGLLNIAKDAGLVDDEYLTPEAVQELRDNSSKYEDIAKANNAVKDLNSLDEDSTYKILLGMSEIYDPADEEGDGIIDDQLVKLDKGTYNNILTTVTNIKDNLSNDPKNKLYSLIEEKVNQNDPLLKLVDSMQTSLGIKNQGIEDLLKGVDQQLSEKGQGNFIIDQKFQEPALKESRQILSLLNSYLISATTDPNNLSGDNSFINRFVEEYKRNNKIIPESIKQFQPLPTLSSDVSMAYIQYLSKYSNYIDYLEKLSKENFTNKSKIFTETKQALTSTLNDFIKNNSSAFDITIGDKDYNLLSGISDNDSTEKKFAIIQKNFHSIKDYDKNFEDILQQFIGKATKKDDLDDFQNTFTISPNLKYDQLSPYSKVILFTTLIGGDTIKFRNNLKNLYSSSNKIPLTEQEFDFQAVNNFINSDYGSRAIDYLAKLNKTNKAILDRIVFVDGSGGAGKTSVVINNVLQSLPADSEVWVAGPTDQQKKNLLNLKEGAKGFNREELMSKIMGDTQFQNMDSTDTKEDNEFYTSIEGPNTRLKLKDTVKVNTTEHPKVLIIDEVTHFKSKDLQVLNKWAKETGTKIIAVGDTYQNGYQGLGLGIDPETNFMFRIPRLSISLRESNYQQSINTVNLQALIANLNSGSLENTQNVIKNLRLQSYQNTLYGTTISDAITDGQINTLEEQLDKLKPEARTIGFIGKEDSDNYRKLKNSKVGKYVQLLSPEKVQGSEFPYVVIDKKWISNWDAAFGNTLYFLRDLYTMITRAQNGSIIIDNGLSKIIKGNQFDGNTSIIQPITTGLKGLAEERLKELDTPIDIEDIKNEGESKQEETDDQPYIGGVENPPAKPEVKPDDQQPKDLNELSLDNPILAYNAQFSSLDVVGKDSEGNQILQNDQTGDEYRDLGIFVKRGEKLEGKAAKEPVYRALDKLVSLIAYKHKISTIPNELRGVINKDTKFRLQLEVRKLNGGDNFIGLNKMDDGQGNNTPYLFKDDKVFSVIASFKDVNGRASTVTLGLINNPETFKTQYADKIKDNKTKAQALKQYSEYVNILNDLASRVTDDNPVVRRDVEVDLTGLTDLRTTHLNQLTQEYEDFPEQTVDQFRKNPTIVTSPIYFYTGGVSNVSDSLKGKAVMFVSGDITLDPNNLAQQYINQKEANKSVDIWNSVVPPSVRMIVLNPKGVSISDLINTNKEELFSITTKTRKGKEFVHKFPYDDELMGYKMYTALWNFRANLLNFLDATKGAPDNYKKAAIAKRQITNGVSTEDALKDNGITQDDLDALDTFNEGLASQVRQFRLGYDPKNQAYLDKLTNITNDNPFYSGIEDPKGIYIDVDTANKYANILNSILDQIQKIAPLKQADGNAWNPRNLITPKEHKFNSLKGLLKSISATGSFNTDEGSIVVPIEDGNYTVKFENQGVIQRIPSIIQKIFNRALIYQYSNGDPVKDIIYSTKDGDIDISPMEVIKAGELSTDIDNDGRIVDDTMANVMSLAFHGNTKLDGNHSVDAYFPYGFFFDPITSGGNVIGDSFIPVATDERLYTTNVRAFKPMFRIKLSKIVEPTPPVNPLDEVKTTIKTNFGKIINGDSMETLLSNLNTRLAGKLNSFANLNYVVQSDSDFKPVTLNQYLQNKLGGEMTIKTKTPSNMVVESKGITYNVRFNPIRSSNLDSDILISKVTSTPEAVKESGNNIKELLNNKEYANGITFKEILIQDPRFKEFYKNLSKMGDSYIGTNLNKAIQNTDIDSLQDYLDSLDVSEDNKDIETFKDALNEKVLKEVSKLTNNDIVCTW